MAAKMAHPTVIVSSCFPDSQFSWLPNSIFSEFNLSASFALRGGGALLAKGRADLLWKMADGFLSFRGFRRLLDVPAGGSFLFG
jgi:hypothetical protein